MEQVSSPRLVKDRARTIPKEPGCRRRRFGFRNCRSSCDLELLAVNTDRAAIRLAVFIEWGQRCTWCHQPLSYFEMELDHLIPKGLSGRALREALYQHGLPTDYKVHSTRNLVPSCRPCNASKSKRLPPTAPGVALLLEQASQHAPEVEKRAAKWKTARGLERALGEIEAADAECLGEEHVAALERMIARVRRGLGPLAFTTRLHPAVAPHDYVPPETRDAVALISKEGFLALLQEWVGKESSARDLGESVFNSTGQELVSWWPLSVDRLEYADEIESFLVRATVDIEYMHYDDEGVGGPADTFATFDLWVSLDEQMMTVIDALDAPMGTFPD